MGRQSTTNPTEAFRTLRETLSCGGATDNNEILTIAIRSLTIFSGGHAWNINWFLKMAGEENTWQNNNKCLLLADSIVLADSIK